MRSAVVRASFATAFSLSGFTATTARAGAFVGTYTFSNLASTGVDTVEADVSSVPAGGTPKVTFKALHRVGLNQTSATSPKGYASTGFSTSGSPEYSADGYIEFIVKADLGSTFSMSKLTTGTLYRIGTGPKLLDVTYSLKPEDTPIPLATKLAVGSDSTNSNQKSYEVTPSAPLTNLTQLIIRLYGYSGNDTTSSLRLTSSMSMYGEDATTPEPTTAVLATLGAAGLLARRSRRRLVSRTSPRSAASN